MPFMAVSCTQQYGLKQVHGVEWTEDARIKFAKEGRVGEKSWLNVNKRRQGGHVARVRTTETQRRARESDNNNGL